MRRNTSHMMNTISHIWREIVFLTGCLIALSSDIWISTKGSNLEEILTQKVSNLPPLVKSTRPYSLTGEPPYVQVGMYMSSISNIDSENQKFDVDLIFRQTWQDPRLNFTEQLNTNYTLAMNNKDLINKVWIPDLFFSNAKSTNHQNRIDNQDLAQVLRVMPGGQIQYTNRMTLDVFCDMNLKKFPGDEQTCKIVIESYGDTDDQINLSWENSDCPVKLEHEYQSPQFHIFNAPCLGVITKQRYYGIGRFTVLQSHVKFHRRMISFVFTVYVPAAMIVLLSTISFWIRPGSVPARVALGITTVLSEATVMSGSLNAYPTVSYLKALDLYTMVCFCFTFCALIEYAIVHIINRRKYLAHMRLSDNVDDDEDDTDQQPPAIIKSTIDRATSIPSSNPRYESGHINSVTDGFPLRKVPARSFQALFDPNLPPEKRPNYRRKPKMIEQDKKAIERQLLIDFVSPLDTVSRFIFPAAFFLFNLFYFFWILEIL